MDFLKLITWKDRVRDCCLTPKEQLFSYHDENKLLLGWKDDDYGTRPTHLVRFV